MDDIWELIYAETSRRCRVAKQSGCGHWNNTWQKVRDEMLGKKRLCPGIDDIKDCRQYGTASYRNV
jgi:hypothetical protein